MSNSVTFWTEGGPTIGMGHVSRCLSIAGALSFLGIASRFFVNDDSAVIASLKDSGFDYSIVPQGAPSVPDVTGGVVVMDTKRDIRRIVAILKETGKKVVVID
ncbi:MAG: hypothetical protein HZB21_03355, partial [Deltaproteobacteria bacterium]|nr:hypothetical protein [Deltaproteobacteria bacterium]